MNQIRVTDYEVRPIARQGEPWQAARGFIREHHYSRGCSNTAVYVHGLYARGNSTLLGVALWLPPTKVAAQSVNPENWTRVLALSRLVVHPDVPTNGASFLMARSIRLVNQDQRFVSLVTYADSFMGHKGSIYRATNWTYVGEMSAQPRWEDTEGRQVAKKATKTRTTAQMLALGYRMVGSYTKHKFIMHLRQQRKGVKAPIRLANDNAIAWFALAA